MKYAIVIPSGGGDRLDVCLNSIDPAIRKHVLIYKNAPGIVERDDVLGYAGTGINDGVSAGWNYGRQYVIKNELDYLFILSQHVVLTDGMRDWVEAIEREQPKYASPSSEGWHLIALSNKLLQMAGEFDTNFYPIYYEDTDYELRMHLLGVLEECYDTPVKALKTPGGYSTTLGMRPEVEGCKSYFILKWGEIFSYTEYEQQTFYPTPFNNPDNSVGYFPHHTTQELILIQGYDKRMYDLYIEDVREKATL